MIWLYLTIHCIILGFFGRYVALQKNRSASEGFLFGFFLSLIGILVVAMMPTNKKELLPKENVSNDKIDWNLYISLLALIGFIGGFIWFASSPRKSSEIDNQWRLEYERKKDSIRKAERKKYNDSIAKINENSNFVKSIRAINNKNKSDE